MSRAGYKKIFWTFFGTFLVLLLWHSSYFRWTANLYEVDPGKFYRSAQLTPRELEEVIQAKGIKTVINLRGSPENSFWYKPQKALLEKLQVTHFDISWTSHYLPRKDQLVKFAEVLQTAERPILVHCRTGSDRTGEASGIYVMEFMGTSREVALREQLHPRYYHLEFLHPAKKKLVRDWQGFEWAKKEYNPCAPENIPYLEHPDC